MEIIKNSFDTIIDKLKQEGKKIEESSYDEVFGEVDKELEEYRFENQKKVKETQAEISSVVLTA